jgi:prevent-host-death family protein
MDWNVAQAKQHLSEVIREAAHTPQLIYNRNRPVAAVIAAEEFANYETWKKTQTETVQKTIAEEFAELRQLMIQAGFENGLETPPRVDRPNAFVQMLEEEYPEYKP